MDLKLVVPRVVGKEYKKMAEMGRDYWMIRCFHILNTAVTILLWRWTEKTCSFPEMIDAQADEMVWFSFITFESKEHRDKVNARSDEGNTLSK